MSFLGFGGGGNSGSSSSSSASNQNNVNVQVEVPLTIDTAGLQKALDALAGSTESGQAAVANAVTSSALISASALSGIGKALDALGKQSGGQQTAIIVAVIGFIGVLIASRIIKVKKGIKL